MHGSGQKTERHVAESASGSNFVKTDVNGPGWRDAKIAEAFGCRTQTIENLRKRLVTEGFEYALDGKKRETPPNPRRLDGQGEAKLIAMRLGKPPAGYGSNVGEEPGLLLLVEEIEQRPRLRVVVVPLVRRETDARHKVQRRERRLLDLGEVILRVPVQLHDAHVDQRLVAMRPDLGEVERVIRHFLRVHLGHDLHAELPLREIAPADVVRVCRFAIIEPSRVINLDQLLRSELYRLPLVCCVQ